MKKKIILPIITGLAIVALSASTVINASGQYAWTGSPVDGGLTNGTCAACHSGGSTTPTMTVSASPAFGSGNTYVPSQTYTINVNVSGSYPKYGFNCEILNTQNTATTTVSTTLGTLTAVSANCQIYPFATTKPYPITASHNAASGSGNAATFSFKWVAPASGTGYLYCVGLGVDMSGNETGDKVTSVAQMTLTPSSGAGIASHSAGDAGLNVFPNPATDNVRITYTLTERSNVTVKLMSLNGELVSDLLNETQDRGVQSVDTHLPIGLAKGMYMVKLTINGKQSLQKLMIL